MDYQNPFVYTDERVSVLFQDNEWVEVMRYAATVTSVGVDGGAYGIWFWAMPGSGIFVNLGKTAVFSQKKRALKWAREQNASAIPCENMGTCKDHSDTRVCAAAMQRGYDSVVMNDVYRFATHCSSTPSSIVEIVLCTNATALQPPCSPCPGLPLRRANGRTCQCNNASSVLSCDGMFESLRSDGFIGYDARPYVMLTTAFFLHVGAVFMAVRAARALALRRAQCGHGCAYKRVSSVVNRKYGVP